MLTPTDLLEIRKIVVSANMVMKGDFADEITKLENAATSAADAHKVEIARLESESIARITAAQASHDQAKAAAEAAAAESKAQLDALNAKHAELSQVMVDADTRLQSVREAMTAHEAAATAKNDELASREVDLNRKEMGLSVREAQLKDAQKALDDKIAKLKSLAG